MNPRSWFPRSHLAARVGALFGWQRLTPVERDGTGSFV